jgi:hypothetical protein
LPNVNACVTFVMSISVYESITPAPLGSTSVVLGIPVLSDAGPLTPTAPGWIEAGEVVESESGGGGLIGHPGSGRRWRRV